MTVAQQLNTAEAMELLDQELKKVDDAMIPYAEITIVWSPSRDQWCAELHRHVESLDGSSTTVHTGYGASKVIAMANAYLEMIK